MAKSVQTCIAKVGEPDIVNGMRTCGEPVFYASKGDIVDGRPAEYTGWRHVYEPYPKTGHLGVPESAI